MMSSAELLRYLLEAMAAGPWWAWPASIVGVLGVGAGLVWWTGRAIAAAVEERRARLVARATGDQDRLRAIRGLRQQLTMDRLIGAQFLVAMGFSAYGMSEVARLHAGIAVPANWLLFVVFEGFALTLMVMINQRAEKALPAGGLGAIYWLVMALAAAFNMTHSSEWVGRAVWGAITLLAAASYALRMEAKRAGREEELRAAEGRASSRRLALVRWLHPVERVRVALEMARDERLGADEATRIVRARVAEAREREALGRVRSAVWELRRAQAAVKDSPESRRAARRERRAEGAAQDAIAAAEMATSAERVAAVLRELQMMALAPTWAALDYSSPDEARRIMQRLITREALEPLALPAAAPAEQTEPVGGSVRTEPVQRPVSESQAGGEPAQATVTPIRARISDEELVEKARRVYRSGMSLAEFRRELGVGMRRAQPLHVKLREKAQDAAAGGEQR